MLCLLEILVESTNIALAQLTLGLLLHFLMVGQGVLVRISALGVRPLREAPLINNLRFARVGVLRCDV